MRGNNRSGQLRAIHSKKNYGYNYSRDKRRARAIDLFKHESRNLKDDDHEAYERAEKRYEERVRKSNF